MCARSGGRCACRAARASRRADGGARCSARLERRRGPWSLRGGRHRRAGCHRTNRGRIAPASLRARLRRVHRRAQRMVRRHRSVYEDARALVQHRGPTDHAPQGALRGSARSGERRHRSRRCRGEPGGIGAKPKRHPSERTGLRLDRSQRRSIGAVGRALDLGGDEPHASAARVFLPRSRTAQRRVRRTGDTGAPNHARSADGRAPRHAGSAAQGNLRLGRHSDRLRPGGDAGTRRRTPTPIAMGA